MAWGALALGAGAGLGSYAAQNSANSQALALQKEMMQKWLDLNIPDPAEQKVVLQRYQQTGQLDPRLQKAIAQGKSSYDSITTDAGLKGAQNNALQQLEDIGSSGGLRLQDKAALQDALMKSQTSERNNRLGVAAEMARRGLSGSGFDVAARLQGQQTAQDQLANASLKTASDAQDRALQAIEGSGQLASQYRNQDYQQASQKAAAEDAINKFNTQNLRDVNAQNTGAENYAQQYNLAQQQRISDQNTQMANAEQMYNKGLIQQNYENQVQRLAGATGQSNAVAGTTQYGGKLLGNTISNLGKGASDAYSAGAKSDFWDNYFKNQNQNNNSSSDDEEE